MEDNQARRLVQSCEQEPPSRQVTDLFSCSSLRSEPPCSGVHCSSCGDPPPEHVAVTRTRVQMPTPAHSCRIVSAALLMLACACQGRRPVATAPSPATRQLSLAQARTEMSDRRARLSRALMAKDRAAVADFFLPEVELVVVDTLRGRDAVLAYMDSLTRDARAFTLSLSREDDV